MQSPADDNAAAIDIDRQIDAAAATQILDVAIAAMLARRHRARTLPGRLLQGRTRELAEDHILRIWWQCQRRHPVRIGIDRKRAPTDQDDPVVLDECLVQLDGGAAAGFAQAH